MTCIGSLIQQYENNLQNKEKEIVKEQKLYKTKDVSKSYPALTPYILDKAVKEQKLSFIKIGNTNYFKSDDLEQYLNVSLVERK